MNYEAIGRCKVLGEKIRELDIERNKAIQELRAEVNRLGKGNINGRPPEVTVFDIGLMQQIVDRISSADTALMATVNEFNNWCQDADERPVKLLATETN